MDALRRAAGLGRRHGCGQGGNIFESIVDLQSPRRFHHQKIYAKKKRKRKESDFYSRINPTCFAFVIVYPFSSALHSDSMFAQYWQPSLLNVKGFQAHADSAVRDLSLAPSDVKFVTGSDDMSIKLWDFETITCERTMKGISTQFSFICLLPISFFPLVYG